MKVEGEVQVETSAENVWKVFMDPDLLCRATRGCEEARRIDETHYEGLVAVRVPLVTIRARIRGELLEAQEPIYLVATLEGETLKVPGSFHARMRIDLVPLGDATRAHYTLDIEMLGPLGNLGEPLVRATSRKIATRFAETIAGIFETAR